MYAFLMWLENLPLSVAIAQSSSIWGFPFILTLHTVGIALTAGPTTVMGLRLTGLVRSVPLSYFRPLFRIFWIGFAINAVSGTLLFMMVATFTGYKPMYYAKLGLLAIALVLLRPLYVAIQRDGITSDADIPSRTKVLAALSLLCWVSVIATGRLVAYAR